jgi:type IV pilus assembly protein PilA
MNRMKRYRNGAARGFSLVELLAVVLVLAVLAGIAIPLYINTRKSSAARACMANIAAIAAAESTYAVRTGAYTPTMATLVGAVEGFAETPHCPLDAAGTASYTLAPSAAGANDLVITCKNAANHALVMTTGTWTKTLAAPAVDSGP